MFVRQYILILSWAGRMKTRIPCMDENGWIGFHKYVAGLTNISSPVGLRQPGRRLRFVYEWWLLFGLVVLHLQSTSGQRKVQLMTCIIWTCMDLNASATERVKTLKIECCLVRRRSHRLHVTIRFTAHCHPARDNTLFTLFIKLMAWILYSLKLY